MTAWQATISQLYSDSQSASLGDNGLALSGPGNFNITANSIDLGISGGISVAAPDSALAAISPYGANINVTTAGNLEMTSTKIANESYLGGINLNVGGTLDVGGQLTTFGDPNAAKGIFTTSGGNISATANGDVNVDGSRIAAYDGGNLNIKSVNGDVNAGTGGEGYVTLNALEIDPTTGTIDEHPRDDSRQRHFGDDDFRLGRRARQHHHQRARTAASMPVSAASSKSRSTATRRKTLSCKSTPDRTSTRPVRASSAATSSCRRAATSTASSSAARASTSIPRKTWT